MSPQIDQLDTVKIVKGLNIGDSGGGKTGALACLAQAGYRLIMFDFDRGWQILMDPKVLPPEFRKNVIVREYEDKIKPTPSGPQFINPPMAWMNFLKDLENSPDTGPLSKLGDKDIIVIDSLTFLGECVMRFHLCLNGRLNKQPWLSDWGLAMSSQEDLLAILFSKAVPCHVIINAHITFIGGSESNSQTLNNLTDMIKKAEKDQAEDEELTEAMQRALVAITPNIVPDKGYPSALGKKLPPRVGTYFNTMVRTKTIGQGASERRIIQTRSDGNIELKVPVPSKIQPTLPIESGWTTIFRAIRGE